MGNSLSFRTATNGGTLGRRSFHSSLAVAAAGIALRPETAVARPRRLPPLLVLTAADFEPLIGARFELLGCGHNGACLWLESATEIGRRGLGGPSGRAPFSLVFTGSPDGPRDQATYRLLHPVAGEVTLLLVPVDRPGKVPRFEAVVG